MSDRKAPRVRFKGRTYFIIGSLSTGGAIATATQYRKGECSYAHLMPDGSIMRFGEVIGSRKDLKSLGKSELPKPSIGSLLNILEWGLGGIL